MADMVELRMAAKKANIPNYRQLTLKQLEEAVKGIKSGDNGSAPKRKSAAAVKSATTPARKSAVKKSVPAKSKSAGTTPAKGTAKRPARKTVARKKAEPKAIEVFEASAPKRRGRPPGSKNKTTTAKTPVRKAAAKATPVRKSTATKTNSNGRKTWTLSATKTIRNFLDNDGIDWKAEWSGGKTGKRAIVLKALRRFKGNKQKAYEHLEDQAMELFGKNERLGTKRTKAEAQSQLRWNIGRIAFDFAIGTGQHKASKKHGNAVKAGLSATTKKVGRPKTNSKAAPARKTAQKASTPKKSAASPQKGSKSPAKDTPAKRGRPKGSTMSDETKAKMKAAAKKRWAKVKREKRKAEKG